MSTSALDAMIEFALQELSTADHARIRVLPLRLASRWPNEPALAICFAFTNAACRLEQYFSDSDKIVNAAFRISAVVAADIHALEAMGKCPATGDDLVFFWKRIDPAFFGI